MVPVLVTCPLLRGIPFYGSSHVIVVRISCARFDPALLDETAHLPLFHYRSNFSTYPVRYHHG